VNTTSLALHAAIAREPPLDPTPQGVYLSGADVAGGLVPADVLLSGLQGQPVHLLTGCVPAGAQEGRVDYHVDGHARTHARTR